MKRKNLSLAVAAAMLLSGSALAASFDGTYTGQMANVWNPSTHGTVTCTGTFAKTIVVREGAFDLVYNQTRNVVVHGTIDASGTVTGFGTESGSGGVALKGQVSGGVITGTVGNDNCHYDLSLTKK